jgi:hypothetical protein
VKKLSLSRLRKPLLISSILLTCACTEETPPVQVDKYCVSGSGLSKFWITLNTSTQVGMIRYQYMGQDVRYTVKAMDIDGSEISGRADFQSSLTGEIRGTPIMFSYDNATEQLKDGATISKCQNRQDNVREE